MCPEKRLHQEKTTKSILFSLQHLLGNTTAYLTDESPLEPQNKMFKWMPNWVHLVCSETNVIANIKSV